MILHVEQIEHLQVALDKIGLGSAARENGSVLLKINLLNLYKSVANIYRAVTMYAPFDFFVNGGKIVIEGREEVNLGEILVGDSAIEIDHYVLKKFNIEPPEYIRRLEQ
jgi:hypothetical protein